MRALVVGDAGHIGSHVARQFWRWPVTKSRPSTIELFLAEVGLIDPGDQSVFVATDVEYHAATPFARSDPRGFLAQYRDGAVLDEAQHAPELFSYLQEEVDRDARKGRFILTGSQHFGLSAAIAQSLTRAFSECIDINAFIRRTPWQV